MRDFQYFRFIYYISTLRGGKVSDALGYILNDNEYKYNTTFSTNNRVWIYTRDIFSHDRKFCPVTGNFVL